MTKTTLVKAVPSIEAERIEPEDDRPKIGSWWWVRASKGTDDEDCDLGRTWLGCVIELGSNYAKLEGVRRSTRVGFDDMHKRCEPCPNPNEFIAGKINEHKGNVRELMGEIQRICHQLGVPLHQALSTGESSTALATAHGKANVKAYEKALIKAKDKTLPELFKKVAEQHEKMATWMKAELIPAEAELTRCKGVTEIIGQKIHTVELYAGLTEELVQVKKGEPADASTKVHLMQRRLYMDEECLAKYEAGGMDFKDIKAFDKWLARDENFSRLLPHERCIVAFRIRRHDKDYGIGDSLSAFIKFGFYNLYNKHTFLYIRNGRQLWRMDTSIEFDEELFPRREDNELLGDHELWIKESEYDIEHGTGITTAARRADMIESWRAVRSYCAQVLWQWHRAGCPERSQRKEGPWNYTAVDSEHEQYRWKSGEVHETSGDPRSWPFGLCHREYEHTTRPDWRNYKSLTPESIYYDDVMKKIARASFEHNRIAVIIQGLLDRSTCLHPHPPWKIWTAEGFATGIELVYDVSLAITDGERPSWEGYRAQLNKSLRPGAVTIGQRAAWVKAMQEKYGERRYWDFSSGEGPKRIARVHQVKRNGMCLFKFTRERRRAKWIPNPERPGWRKLAYPEIDVNWWCSPEHLTCIDAYTPGDFHIFYDDPRTRADYIQWAPILLSAEDWHAKRRTATDETEDEDE